MYTSLVPVLFAVIPIEADIIYRPAIGTVNCPVVLLTTIPPTFVIGIPENPVMGVTVVGG